MRVLVLGAGHADFTLARDLGRRPLTDVDLAVINDSPHHLVQHEVYHAIRRPAVADAIQVPLDEAFDRAGVVIDRATGVGRDTRAVELAAGNTPDYDYCAVCLGAQTAYYGTLGFEACSVPPKRVADAETIRTRFFDDCDGGGTVVVGGAGLSDARVAGEFAALRDEEGTHADTVLVERLDAVTPSFDASFRRAVRDELFDRGAKIRTKTAVESVTDATVRADTGDIDYDLFVWTGGIADDDAMGSERPTVRADSRLDWRTLAVGDTARAINAGGEPAPASVSAALREAKTVAGNIAAQVELETGGDEDEFAPRPDPYRFEAPGWAVSVGDGAVAQVGPSTFRGKAVKAMKTTVGAGHFTSVGAISWTVDLVDEELHA